MDITKILEAILSLAAAVILYLIVPWLKARTTNEQQETIRALIRSGVFAAEQLYGAGDGKKKLDFVRTWLEGYGYEVDVTEIEAAVGQYINAAKHLPAGAKENEPPDTVEKATAE